MIKTDQATEPEVQLVEENGETTLYVEGRQAMQAWEADLMRQSADILCTYGSEFLEVGLGLGISALHIAHHAATRHHTVVEKYPRVIELFRERNETPPALEIVQADFFDHVYALRPESLDGIFFDPFFGTSSIWDDPAIWNEAMPYVVSALRPGGVFLPCFSTLPVLRPNFVPFFDRIIIERRSFRTYESTNYTPSASGDAFIQCFVRTR